MTDTIIALIPDYGLFLLFGVVSLACLAVPLPSSMLVLASGAFAATEDLTLWHVLVVTFVAFVIGDQLAFRIAAAAGPRLLGWVRSKPRMVPVLTKSEALLDRRGKAAVLLSHTVLSPTCPYISYLCGAGGMAWPAFSVIATIGAAIWVTAYVSLGYIFASQLTQVASLLSQFFGLAIAVALALVLLHTIRQRWQAHAQKTT